MTRHRIVLDTDIGTDADDALCVGLALASPEIEIAAVTHVSASSRTRARISRRLLDLAGRPDIPVYAGCDKPRDGGDRFAWFGHEGRGILDDAPSLTVEEAHSVEVLKRLFAVKSDLELVAIGPLTNIATALADDPTLAQRIKLLTIMGGYVRGAICGGGMVSPIVDYNLRSDPRSALEVLTAGIPIRMVPTDVTLQVWMNAAQLRELETSTSPFQRAVARSVPHWTPLQQRIFTHLGARLAPDNVAFLHDPLALACVYDESFCTFEELAIAPRIEEELFRTWEKPRGTPGTVTVRCATAVDAARFQAHCHQRLGSIR